MEVHLHPKQALCLKSEATEILYGGAAGGGKSHLLRVIAIMYAHGIPGIQVYLFRRLSDDLAKNHVFGPTGFLALLAEWINDGTVRYNSTERSFTWVKTGSKIFLCHCQYETDVIKYQGPEIHVLLIDELTHFTEYQYRFLRGRVRPGGLPIPAEYKNKLPLIVCGSNPGNIGHAWVKSTFITYGMPYDVNRTPANEGGMLRQFIPALLEDNPTLCENDPGYENRLQGLGSEELVKAMRYGDWDIVAGAAFEKLSRSRHMLRSFVPPLHWQRFVSMDWGSAKPFAIGWFVVCDDDLELKAKEHWAEMYIPAGSIIMYREWYGWNGQADKGLRMESPEVAKKLLDIEWEANEWEGDDVRPGLIDYRIADSAMWSVTDGPSPMERLYQAGVKWMLEHKIPNGGSFAWRKSRKDRAANYQEIRHRIVGDDNHPLFYVTENCTNFWRTVPDLQLDQLKPELGWDTNQEDHVADMLAYALASRPLIVTQDERIQHEYKVAKKLANKHNEMFNHR